MKRGGWLKRKTGFKTRGGPLRRTTLKTLGQSDNAIAKREIQYLVREIVMIRDGGCIFRVFPWHVCSGFTKNGDLILQADHLVTRANSATYDDTRLIVCVCKGIHGWKSVGSNARKKEYDALVRQILPPERVTLWDRAENDSWKPVRHYASDWRLSVAALKQELSALQAGHETRLPP